MKKILASLIFLLTFSGVTWSQNNEIRPAAIGVSFFFNDFTTPQRIRNSSLSSVINEDSWAKFREMSPGIALSFFQGLHKHIDFAGTIGGSFVRMPKQGTSVFGDEKLLLEVDASFNFKMLSESFVLTPYLIAGMGASRYNKTYGAFLPLGGGFKINLYDEASIFISTQYRLPLTPETNNHHFVTSIGISGVVGKKKN
jgi:OmpA-OmpF porin, OOP family